MSKYIKPFSELTSADIALITAYLRTKIGSSEEQKLRVQIAQQGLNLGAYYDELFPIFEKIKEDEEKQTVDSYGNPKR